MLVGHSMNPNSSPHQQLVPMIPSVSSRRRVHICMVSDHWLRTNLAAKIKAKMCLE